MSHVVEALERAEKVEHVAHAEHADHGGHGGTKNKLIGLTMGLIGVLIALCAALVGGERNEMTRAMIEQTQATSDAVSASIKFRVIMLDVEKLRFQAPETVPQQLRERFTRLYDDYTKERKYTGDWASAYQPLVDAHFAAAEEYEHAQLAAEIGIVFASLAVLLSSVPAWILSIILGAISIGWAVVTFVETRVRLSGIEANIETQHEAYLDLRKAHTGDHADADAADALDPGGVIRKAIAEAAKAAEEARKGHEEKPKH